MWGATRLVVSENDKELFQSTLPVWGATLKLSPLVKFLPIPIHAPRVGSDQHGGDLGRAAGDFNPRSPCGERPGAKAYSGPRYIFQSTLPVWGATWLNPALRIRLIFQSTLPVWGATENGNVIMQQVIISIHAPRVGSDFHSS